MIPELLITFGLPILQSIIAARIDSTLNDWVKRDDSAEEGRFNHIMKAAFVKAVKRIKGDNPKIIKDTLSICQCGLLCWLCICKNQIWANRLTVNT